MRFYCVRLFTNDITSIAKIDENIGMVILGFELIVNKLSEYTNIDNYSISA